MTRAQIEQELRALTETYRQLGLDQEDAARSRDPAVFREELIRQGLDAEAQLQRVVGRLAGSRRKGAA